MISPKLDEIDGFILHDLHSGATLNEIIGAYDNTPEKKLLRSWISTSTESGWILSVIGGRRRGENQLVARADHVNSFHDISQLPDISRPGIAKEAVLGLLRQPEVQAQGAFKGLHQGQDILPPLPLLFLSLPSPYMKNPAL